VSGIRLRLTFPEALVREPVIARLVEQFAVVPNIRRADVRAASGWMICEMEGDPSAVEAAMAWLDQQGVTVDLLGDVLES
jgi:ABC-type methionine transport system ATPase subunit